MSCNISFRSTEEKKERRYVKRLAVDSFFFGHGEERRYGVLVRSESLMVFNAAARY